MLRTGIEQDQPRSSLPGLLLSPGQAASPSIPGGNFEHPGREHPERECPAWNVLPGMSRLGMPSIPREPGSAAGHPASLASLPVSSRPRQPANEARADRGGLPSPRKPE